MPSLLQRYYHFFALRVWVSFPYRFVVVVHVWWYLRCKHGDLVCALHDGHVNGAFLGLSVVGALVLSLSFFCLGVGSKGVGESVVFVLNFCTPLISLFRLRRDRTFTR